MRAAVGLSWRILSDRRRGSCLRRSGVTTGATKAYRQIGERGWPVLLIWGREDRVVPSELSETVKELIPNAEFHAIKDAAHSPHYERPEAVNPLLIEFLTA